MKFDPELHHRWSIRLKGYDYSQARAYFVTIVAWNHCFVVGATDRSPLPHEPAPKSLGALIAGFKTSVTKRINILRDVQRIPVWQRNHCEHIIRNEREMDRISRYIESNPSQCAEDDENPNRIPK